MSQIIAGPADIAAGADHLVSREPRFAAVIEQYGLPSARLVENSLPSLLRLMTEQLISLQAAAAIWQRLHARLHPYEPSSILKITEQDLKSCGITGAKARSFLAIARAVAEGHLDFQQLAALGNDEAIVKLVSLPGVGHWTADSYLLTALGRSDAWPAGDLALQIAAQDLFELPDRPTLRLMKEMAEGWRPWRSVAARLLWSHYRGLKGLSQPTD